MSEVKLGKVLDNNTKAYRDAVHVAVCPVTAGVTLEPGERVGLTGGQGESGYHVVANEVGKCIGIVDPFLEGPVQPGESFYLFLFPNTVTSLRHAWTHPAFMATMR